MLEVDIERAWFGRISRLADDLIAPLRLAVPPRAHVSLLGPSGSGKSTLLRIIAGLHRSFLGKITIDGTLATGPTRAIQMVFQDGRLLPWLRVEDNLRFAVSDFSIASEDRIDALIHWLMLGERRASWPRDLSGGEESRAALGRALVAPPRVLLLDEALRNLDPGTRLMVQERLDAERSRFGFSVISVTHSLEDALLASDRVICFASRPLRISLELEVAIGGPRSLDDPQLRGIAEALRRQVFTDSKAAADHSRRV